MSTIARYDKYSGQTGGFRAPLAAAMTATSGAGSTNQVAIPLGVGLNASGAVVVGAGSTGIVGVLVVDQAKAIGDVVDIMTSGEIVDLDEAAFDPGVKYYVNNTTGALETSAPAAGANKTLAGVTVGDKSLTSGTIRSRLVVRVGQIQG